MTRMIRRLLCLALAALMLSALLPYAVSGRSARAATWQGIVTRDEVNFRVGPSMGDKLLFKLRKGAVCTILNRITANGYEWFEVTAADPATGREYTGYIRGDCFRPLEEGESGSSGGSIPPYNTSVPTNSSATANNQPAPANAVGTVNDWGVNLRATPWGNVITKLDQGVKVTVLTVPPKFTREYWFQVEYKGQQGYIMASYLDYKGKTAKPTATPAPGTATPTPTPAPAPVPAPQTAAPAVNPYTSGNQPAPANAVGTINDWGVNLRTAPWGNVIARLDQGVQVRVLTVPPKFTREYWFLVEYNGQQGYVMASYLTYKGKTAKPTATPAPGAATPTPQPSVPTAAPDQGGTASEILGYVMTTTGSVNVRASIGGTSLTQVGIWETFPYLLPPVQRGNYTWYFVQLKSGLKGYIRGDCVKIVSAPSPTAYPGGIITPTPAPGIITPTPVPGSNTPAPDYTTPTGYVKTTMDDVNVRKGIWGDLVTVVRKAGTVFPYYGEPRISGSTKWYFIKGDTFGYAYIHGGFVTETNKKGADVTPTPTPNVTPQPGSNTPVPGGTRNEANYTTLRPGSSGAAVLNLVRELKNQGYFKGTETNKYNSAVENAVRAFQKAKKLKVDGIAGNDTQHALFNTVPIGTSDYSTDPSMTFYPAEKIDWYTGGIDELWPRGSNFLVYDVKTGITWWAHRWSGGLHVDAEPLTASDTARLCKIYSIASGKTITDAQQIADLNLYERRPCLVTIGTRTFACSLYGVPHNYPDGDTISTNNFKGQVCIHFTNSKTHDSKKVDSGHQEAIQYAWENAPKGHK